MHLEIESRSTSCLNALEPDPEWFIEEVRWELSSIDENGVAAENIGHARFTIVDLEEASMAGIGASELFDQGQDLDWMHNEIVSCRIGESPSRLAELVLVPNNGAVLLLQEIFLEKPFRGGQVLDVFFEMLKRQYQGRCRYVIAAVVPIDRDEDGTLRRWLECVAAEQRLFDRYQRLGFERLGQSGRCMVLRLWDYEIDEDALSKMKNPFVQRTFETAVRRTRSDEAEGNKGHPVS